MSVMEFPSSMQSQLIFTVFTTDVVSLCGDNESIFSSLSRKAPSAEVRLGSGKGFTTGYRSITGLSNKCRNLSVL